MIGITGRRSSITQEFLKLTRYEATFGSADELPLDLPLYLLCAGVLVGKSANDIKDDEAWQTFDVNCLSVIRFCDKLFARNPHARVCVIGSESGNGGSYDTVYAASKAGIHLYVETKRLKYSGQHLVCISPTVIEDSGMTDRRIDKEQCLQRGNNRRLKRWLTSLEVAKVAEFALLQDSMCNTVIRLTGGNW